MTSPIQKPCALLRQMAERRGQKITARDAAALQLAAATLEAMEAARQRAMQAWSDKASEAIRDRARANTLEEGLRALLEVVA